MNINLPKLYPITDRKISGMSHAEQVKQLLEGGARLIQLREKLLSPRAFFDDASAAVRLAHDAAARIIINDRVDVALALHADGVHLGQTDMPVDAARSLLGSKAIIGFSTHNPDQVRQAATLPIDYLAFGPIYATTSKDNPDPVAGPDQLREVKRLAADLPVVAIGGLSQTNVRWALEAGADSVALISAILSDPTKIATITRNLAAHLENFQIGDD